MTHPGLAAELARRLRDDQEARRLWANTPDGLEQMLACDRENSRWLKEVICRLGWPGSDMVGKAGAEAAWVLAQHADHDVVFQRQCLDLLIEASDRGQAPRRQVAYLTDRVMLKQRELQRYGTQHRKSASGGYEPYPSQEPDTLAARRAAMDLTAAEAASWLSRLA